MKLHKIDQLYNNIVLRLSNISLDEVDKYHDSIFTSLPEDFLHYDNIIFDFEKINFMNSRMVGVYLNIYKKCIKAEKGFYCINMPESFYKVFKILKLNTTLNVYKKDSHFDFENILRHKIGEKIYFLNRK